MDVADLSASARGPPIWADWCVPQPAAQFSWGLSLSAFTSWGLCPSPLPVDSFNDTSDEWCPRMDMERYVEEVAWLLLLPLAALSGSWIDLGQSSKKCRRTRPSDLPSPETFSVRCSKRPLFSVFGSGGLHQKQRTWSKNHVKSIKKEGGKGSRTQAKHYAVVLKRSGWDQFQQNPKLFPRFETAWAVLQ